MDSYSKYFLSAFTCLIVIFSCFVKSTRAQGWKLELKGSFQMPLIRDLESCGTVPMGGASGYSTSIIQYKVKEHYSVKPGSAFQLAADHELGSGFYAGAGIGFQLLRFRRTVTTEVPGSFPGLQPAITGIPYSYFYSRDTLSDSTLIRFTDPGTALQTPADAGKTRCLRFEVPVFAGYRFPGGKASVSLGVNTSVLAWSEQYQAIYGRGSNETGLTRKTTGEGLSPVTFSFTAEAVYRLISVCRLYARYSLPLTALYEKDYQYAGKTGCHILEAGLSYRILSLKK